jgi:hypothetical protein
LSGFAQSKDAQSNVVIYAYGDVFGAWRTDNKGVTWRYLNWNIPGGAIAGTGMAVRPNDPQVVFYSANNELYRSTNGGDNWSKRLDDVGYIDSEGRKQGPPRFRGSSPILINSSDTKEIWFAGPRWGKTGWLWKSTDGGDNFNKVSANNFDSNKAMTLYQSPVNPSQIWVGSENGLYVTIDGGSNFTKITSEPNIGSIQQYATGTHKGVLLFTGGPGCCPSNGLKRIYSSTGNYTDFSKYVVESPSIPGGLGYPTGLKIFSDNSAVAWNTDAKIQAYSTDTDGGKNFSKRATTLNTSIVPVWTNATLMAAKNHPDYGTDQVIQVGDNPDHWMITGGGAAMESTNKGKTWSYFPNGSGIAAVKTYTVGLSRFDENRMFIPASDIGGAVVTDGGFSGTAASSPKKVITDPNDEYLMNSFRFMEGPNKNDIVMAGMRKEGQIENDKPLIVKSSDGGINWAVASHDLPNIGIVKAVMSLTDKDDFLVVLADKNQAKKVYRTKNGGTNFSEIPGLPDYMGTGYRYDNTAAFIERDATETLVRYFVAREKEVEITNADGTKSTVKYSTPFYRSTNGGDSWSETATHPFVKDGKRQLVWGVVADPVRSKTLWVAGGDNSVKYSTDGGDTWNSIPKYFVTKHVGVYNGKIAVWGKAENEEERLWYSPDNGANWYVQTNADKNFHGVQGITVDSRGRIWVSWNSVTVVTPVTGPTQGSANANDVGFENDFTGWGTPYGTPTPSINTANVRSGSKSAYFVGGSAANAGSGANYTVTGLTAGATYIVKAWVKAVSGSNIWITAAPSGGSQVGQQMTSTNWTQSGDIILRMGANATSATLSAWVGQNSSAYFDDFTIELLSGTGSVKLEQWTGISGTAVADIPVNSTTNKTTTTLTSLESTASGNEYGVRIRGYIVPTTNGNYYFYIASDDNGEFWLSSDEQPSNKGTAPIAKVTSWTNAREWQNSSNGTTQKSAVKSLQAGRRYYFEALMKEGLGGDNLAIGWTTATDNSGITVIGSNNIASYSCSNCRTANANAEVESSKTSESLVLQLHPNPTNGEVNISLAGFEEESSVQVKMSDMNGRSFVRHQVQPRLEGKQVSLSVGHLPQGLFFVTVQGSKVGKTAKLVITR